MINGEGWWDLESNKDIMLANPGLPWVPRHYEIYFFYSIYALNQEKQTLCPPEVLDYISHPWPLARLGGADGNWTTTTLGRYHISFSCLRWTQLSKSDMESFDWDPLITNNQIALKRRRKANSVHQSTAKHKILERAGAQLDGFQLHYFKL